MIVHYLQPQNGARIPPYARQGIKIENGLVYTNGSVFFTAHCYFISYGLPEPSGDQYQIQYVYLWTERNKGYVMEFSVNDDGTIIFNQTLGDIQNTSEIMITNGDLNLAVDEEVSIRFQTSFPLNTSSSIYVGVLAIGDSGLHRWEQNTTVIGLNN